MKGKPLLGARVDTTATATARTATAAAHPATPGGLPVGRRTPRGRRRWYLVHTPEGQEQATCDKVRSIVPSDVLEDAFVIRKERWTKKQGTWSLRLVEMYQEYFFVVTSDVCALDKELSRLTFPARIAKTDGRSFAPLSVEAQEWFENALDKGHVLRSSVAVIEDGVLHVQDGPLVGQEERVSKLDRHRRRCVVTISDGVGGTFTESVPIDVPSKS